MRNMVYFGVATVAACLWGSGASAQSGAINKAVGGYSFEEAAKEAPATTARTGYPPVVGWSGPRMMGAPEGGT